MERSRPSRTWSSFASPLPDDAYYGRGPMQEQKDSMMTAPAGRSYSGMDGVDPRHRAERLLSGRNLRLGHREIERGGASATGPSPGRFSEFLRKILITDDSPTIPTGTAFKGSKLRATRSKATLRAIGGLLSTAREPGYAFGGQANKPPCTIHPMCRSPRGTPPALNGVLVAMGTD